MNTHVVKKLFWELGMPIVGVCIIVLQLTRWLPSNVNNPDVTDADVYRAAALHAAMHEQVYAWPPRTRIDDVPVSFFYPPPALAFISPAARLDKPTWRYVCFGLALGSVWLLAAALVKLGTSVVDLRRTLSVGALLSVFPPIAQSIGSGNFDMPIIAMTAWALAMPRIAAPLLVVAASIKVYPAFALIALFPREDLEVEGYLFRAQAVVTVLVIVVLTPLMLGAHYITEWIRLCLPSLSDPVLHDGNWSLSTILVHSSLKHEIANTPCHVRIILSAAPLLAAFGIAFYTRKRPSTISATAALIAGTWFTAFCWWWRILPLLTIAVAVWYKRREVR